MSTYHLPREPEGPLWSEEGDAWVKWVRRTEIGQYCLWYPETNEPMEGLDPKIGEDWLDLIADHYLTDEEPC